MLSTDAQLHFKGIQCSKVNHQQKRIRYRTQMVGSYSDDCTLTLARILSPQCHAMRRGKACHFGDTQRILNPCLRPVRALYTHKLRTVYAMRGQKWAALAHIDTQWHHLFTHRLSIVRALFTSTVPHCPAVSRTTRIVPAVFPHRNALHPTTARSRRGNFWSRFVPLGGTLYIYSV